MHDIYILQTVRPTGLGSRFDHAFAAARSWHATQARKGTTIPYIAHLLGVCALVLEDGGDEDEAIAALLHDAIEDAENEEAADARRRQIHVRFGRRVLRIVEGCTDAGPAEKRSLPYAERKARFAERMRHAPADVRRVVAADKLHNARAIAADFRSIGDAVWARFSGSREEVLTNYRSIAESLLAAGTGRLAVELAEIVAELSRSQSSESRP